jgi:hypothetical protein
MNGSTSRLAWLSSDEDNERDERAASKEAKNVASEELSPRHRPEVRKHFFEERWRHDELRPIFLIEDFFPALM